MQPAPDWSDSNRPLGGKSEWACPDEGRAADVADAGNRVGGRSADSSGLPRVWKHFGQIHTNHKRGN
ncbi:unnamed protein product [Angiostrongylus costaricensis]|uniref:Uncharacterized protein n=1 Tax=Angiostrongylus costaricensis TaxID=334426 RepID=A0A0R3PJD7_ANGCS|nr:unnamed protein product [Angiostrongylus costaricensis]